MTGDTHIDSTTPLSWGRLDFGTLVVGVSRRRVPASTCALGVNPGNDAPERVSRTMIKYTLEPRPVRVG